MKAHIKSLAISEINDRLVVEATILIAYDLHANLEYELGMKKMESEQSAQRKEIANLHLGDCTLVQK